MNEDLKYTFSNINEWLKFAEAKNAGLLALNIASLLGLLQADAIFKDDLKTFQGIMIIMFCISSCLCLYSVLPIINKGFRFFKKLDDANFQRQLDTLNALYFGDIAMLSADQFSKLFEHKYNLTLSLAEKDLCSQITNNADICWQKFAIFKPSMWFSFCAFAMGIIIGIAHSLS